MFDMLEELAAIHRRVARDAVSQTVSVSVTRAYEADAAEVWDALTNPERLPRWFYPVTGDLEVGGTFQLEGNAGGDILRCERPARLEVTFGGPASILDVRLTEASGTTTLELTHTVPLAMAGSGAGALFVGPGWDGALLGLGLHLGGVTMGDPLEAANLPEVIEFNRGSIAGWTEAIESSETATEREIADARETAVAQYTRLPA
jgi:uncharacterized protein YndB with AHSA1/START domain